MNQKQMHEFLMEVHRVHKDGGDVKQVIAKYEQLYRYVYIFQDMCAKYILTGNGKDTSLVSDLVNAALGLCGCDCISDATLENPVQSGGPLYKDIEHDVLLSLPPKQVGAEKRPGVRIGFEIQHVKYDAYHNRLLFYVARSVNNTLQKGDFYDKMPDVNVISFQMFDYLPWNKSRRYVHTIRYMDDEFNTFSKQQTLTIVEVKKFLKHSKTDYASDNSRLAQWLRAIDALNNNADYSEFKSDSIFLRLQNWAKLSNFLPEVFIQAGESMKDDVEVAVYVACQKLQKKSAAIIAAKDKELIAKDAEIASKDESLVAKDAEIASKDESLIAQAAEIAKMKAELEALRALTQK